MTDLSKEYYSKWIEQANENKQLKLQLERYQKIFEEDKLFKSQYYKYKKHIQPIADNYDKLYDWASEIYECFKKLEELYSQNIELSKLFDIKINSETKDKLVKETQNILSKYLDMKCLPKQYPTDWIQDVEGPTMRTVRKEFKRKNFVVKKNK